MGAANCQDIARCATKAVLGAALLCCCCCAGCSFDHEPLVAKLHHVLAKR
jgi:hypothetical protein